MKELISREQMIKEIGNINIKKLEENKETNEQLNGKDKILADLRENINFLEKNISEHKTELFNVIEEQNKKFNKICDRLYEIKDLTREECLNKGIDYNNVLDEIIDLKNQFDKYEPLDLSNIEIENESTKENVIKYVIKDEINDQRIKYNNLLEEYKEKLDEKEQVKNERKKLLDSLSNLNEPSEEKTKEETNELNNERITSINDTLAAIENELNNLKTSDMTQPNISLEQSNPLTEESLSEEQNEPLLSTEPNLETENENLSTSTSISVDENIEQDNNVLNTEVAADNTNTSVKKSPVIISAKISNIAMTKMGKIDQLRNVFFKNQQNGYNVLRKKIENNTNTISAASTSNSIENNTQQLENTATPLNQSSENSKIISLETFKNQMNNSNASSSISNEKIISLDDLRKNTLQNSTDSNPSGGNAINNEAKSLTLKAA